MTELSDFLGNGEKTLYHNGMKSRIKFEENSLELALDVYEDDKFKLLFDTFTLQYAPHELEKNGSKYLTGQIYSHEMYKTFLKETLNRSKNTLANTIKAEHEMLGSMELLQYGQKIAKNLARFFISAEHLLKGKIFKNEMKKNLSGSNKLKDNYLISKQCIEYGKEFLEKAMDLEKNKDKQELIKSWNVIQGELIHTYSILIGVQENIIKSNQRKHSFFFE